MFQLRRDRRTVAVLLAAAIVIVVGIVLALTALLPHSDSFSGDPALRRTAQRAVAAIQSRAGKLPMPDASLNSFKAWGYNTHTGFVHIRPQSIPRGTFVQVQLSDPSAFPPQFLTLDTGGHAAVGVDEATITRALKSRGPVCSDVHLNSTTFRTCLVGLPTPANLQPAGMTGVVGAFTTR